MLPEGKFSCACSFILVLLRLTVLACKEILCIILIIHCHSVVKKIVIKVKFFNLL